MATCVIALELASSVAFHSPADFMMIQLETVVAASLFLQH